MFRRTLTILSFSLAFALSSSSYAGTPRSENACQTQKKRVFRSGMEELRSRFPERAATPCDPRWLVFTDEELERAGVPAVGFSLFRLLPHVVLLPQNE